MTEAQEPDNPSDQEKIRAKQKALKQKEKRDRRDLQEVLATTVGRRVFWRLLEKAGPFRSIWEPTVKIHFLAGMQEMGQWLMHELEQADLKNFHKMREEAMEERDA